jgi:uncharacterized protein
VDLKMLKQQIVAALKPLDPEKVILFGSYAYGTPTPDSDLDICIVKKRYESKWKEKEKIRKLLIDISLPKDILVSYPEEYDFYKKEINSVFNEIDIKGDILWQKNS